MGCADSSVKQNVIIQVAYCGSCGWSMTAKKLCDLIKKQLPKSVIDCRPENQYTGALKASLIVDRRQKKQIYKGDKDSTVSNMDKISADIVKAYREI